MGSRLVFKPYMTEEEIQAIAEQMWLGVCHGSPERESSTVFGNFYTRALCLERARKLAEDETKQYDRAKEIIDNKEIFDVDPYVKEIAADPWHWNRRACFDKLNRIARNTFEKYRDSKEEHHNEVQAVRLAVKSMTTYLQDFERLAQHREVQSHEISFSEELIPKEVMEGVRDLAREEGEG